MEFLLEIFQNFSENLLFNDCRAGPAPAFAEAGQANETVGAALGPLYLPVGICTVVST